MLVTGEYDVNEVPGQQVDMMVTDTKGQHFVNRESTDKGKFAFTTDDYDVFEICFISRVPTNMRGGRYGDLKKQDIVYFMIFSVRHEVFLQTKHGVEAKNYENLGDAAKLKPLEVELKRLEDLSESIVQDFAHMRQREVCQDLTITKCWKFMSLNYFYSTSQLKMSIFIENFDIKF